MPVAKPHTNIDDLWVVLRAQHELVPLLQHFSNSSQKRLHSLIDCLEDGDLSTINSSSMKQLRMVASIRNAIMHDAHVAKIPDRLGFEERVSALRRRLQEGMPDTGASENLPFPFSDRYLLRQLRDLIDASKYVESVLADRLGASGRGLSSKLASVTDKLPRSVASQIHEISQARDDMLYPQTVLTEKRLRSLQAMATSIVELLTTSSLEGLEDEVRRDEQREAEKAEEHRQRQEAMDAQYAAAQAAARKQEEVAEAAAARRAWETREWNERSLALDLMMLGLAVPLGTGIVGVWPFFYVADEWLGFNSFFTQLFAGCILYCVPGLLIALLSHVVVSVFINATDLRKRQMASMFSRPFGGFVYIVWAGYVIVRTLSGSWEN